VSSSLLIIHKSGTYVYNDVKYFLIIRTNGSTFRASEPRANV
jgi:hypothetical protein